MSAGAAKLDETVLALRTRLVRRLLYTLTPLALFLFYLRWDRGPMIRVPAIILTAVLLWGLWQVRRGRTLRAPQVFGLAAVIGSFEIYWGIAWPGGGLAPVLALVGTNGLLFYLCWGPAAGWTVFGLAVACILGVTGYQRPLPPDQLSLASDLLFAALAVQAMAWSYSRTYSLLWRELGRRRRLLEAEAQNRAGLMQALLQDLEAPLRAAGAGADPASLAPALTQGLRQARHLRLTLDAAEEVDVDLNISRRLLPPLLGLGVGIALAIGLRDLSMDLRGAWIALTLAAVMAGLFAALRRWPLAWERVAAAALGASAAAAALACLRAPAGSLPPALAYGTVLVVFAALWLGLRPALACTVLLAGLDLWAWRGRGAGLPPNEVSMAVNFLEQWCTVIFIIAPAAQWQHETLLGLDRQRARLADGLRVRRRLLGTLYHDAANLVQAMGILGGPEADGEDRRRFERLRVRLARLIGSARFWLFEDGDFAPEQLQSLELRAAVLGLQDVFKERLEAKGLRLELDVPAGLRVRAVPELLADGVLGNLLSNAIKFSPRGGRLRLGAWQQDGKICLAVRDEGGGFSAAGLDSFAGERALASTLGTEGESGQGLGLALASEHLRRMGGRLEAANAAGGGAEPKVWMVLA